MDHSLLRRLLVILCYALILFSYLLATLLVGHPFGGTKKMIWLTLLCAFFGLPWDERNDRLFMILFPFLIDFFN